ncbi:YggS family pyridoxal phosphate-dependent enzyme [Flavobacterium aurantiibacter]|uniref:Pyridoxal phosphate homeostasis protein n=1 Tax=Flavobacterium aurantiibacter TaxID=2023067 RepID=A0A255ZRS8_9FLAO|nr:YggS family pyridoxal phosphate-dependent enzyme [Flavobacterium aurantiibacter]OYQ43420.1 YggS family pyridoxal phosphate-dependent enzyme [Flavobacterium aurantiibacter]
MTTVRENLLKIKENLPESVTLVAVSKTKPNSLILEAYAAGQRIFGENKVQELTQKAQELPKDIEWHMIGHLQRNKVKQLLPHVALIHGVDSLRLYLEIEKEASKLGHEIAILLQVYIAGEETKFGLDEAELEEILNLPKSNFVRIRGLMGMASFTENREIISAEFNRLNRLYQKYALVHNFDVLSMGMSGDYPIAIENGSTMIRVGSAIFGTR